MTVTTVMTAMTAMTCEISELLRVCQATEIIETKTGSKSIQKRGGSRMLYLNIYLNQYWLMSVLTNQISVANIKQQAKVPCLGATSD